METVVGVMEAPLPRHVEMAAQAVLEMTRGQACRFLWAPQGPLSPMHQGSGAPGRSA